MNIIYRTNLTSEQTSKLEREIPIYDSLMQVYGHYRNRIEGALLSQAIPEIIKQDEFSIDVVFPWLEGLVLVYGTT